MVIRWRRHTPASRLLCARHGGLLTCRWGDHTDKQHRDRHQSRLPQPLSHQGPPLALQAVSGSVLPATGSEKGHTARRHGL